MCHVYVCRRYLALLVAEQQRDAKAREHDMEVSEYKRKLEAAKEEAHTQAVRAEQARSRKLAVLSKLALKSAGLGSMLIDSDDETE